MGSTYGVAWPMPLTFGRSAGSNQTCPAGVETTIMTWSNLQAAAPGFYYPVLIGNIPITLGATPPTALSLSFHQNGGSTFATIPIWAPLLTANANLWYPFSIVGNLSGSIFYPGPASFQVGLTPTGQSATYTDAPTNARILLFRGPDS